MARRHVRKRHGSVALLALTLSSSPTRALRPASVATSSGLTRIRPPGDAARFSGAVRPVPGGRAVCETPAASTSNTRRSESVWRLGAAGYGSAFGKGSSDNEQENEQEKEEVREEPIRNRVSAAAKLAASAASEASSAAALLAAELNRESQSKRATLWRTRRRARAKIKAAPAAAIGSSAPAERGVRKAAVNTGVKARNVNLGGDDAVSGRSERRSWGGAIGSAVFGTPTRFFRRRVDACKSFVTSRERVHWVSLVMALYIATTSIAPRFESG